MSARRSVSELLRQAADRLDELDPPTSTTGQQGVAAEAGARATGSSQVLRLLTSFWTGWDVVPEHLNVEVVDTKLPHASTCFLTLKLSKSAASYDVFENDLMASISSSYAGFGQY